ncbi:hypothetical protein MTO96_013005 [Rhipicephalus appendiculatus]
MKDVYGEPATPTRRDGRIPSSQEEEEVMSTEVNDLLTRSRAVPNTEWHRNATASGSRTRDPGRCDRYATRRQALNMPRHGAPGTQRCVSRRRRQRARLACSGRERLPRTLG